MASPVDEIVQVTQCEPALAHAVLDNVTDDVSSPVRRALHFSRFTRHHSIHFAGATSYIVDS
jgi:hypothetical protein